LSISGRSFSEIPMWREANVFRSISRYLKRNAKVRKLVDLLTALNRKVWLAIAPEFHIERAAFILYNKIIDSSLTFGQP